jgi:hypothetical protein
LTAVEKWVCFAILVWQISRSVSEVEFDMGAGIRQTASFGVPLNQQLKQTTPVAR